MIRNCANNLAIRLPGQASGPWLEPCPRSLAARDTSLLITVKIRRSKLTHRCTKVYLGMSGATECSSTWQKPGRCRAISISIWFVFIMTKLGRCQTTAIKLSLGWPRRFLKVVVWKYCRVMAINLPQSMCNVWTFYKTYRLFGNSAYLPLILLVSTGKRWTLMTYTKFNI